jgi:glycosyltransferase involved in cell wall biosynthesis
MRRISIVSTSFNQAKFLEDCLLSVKEQNYPGIEHIVVDGGSTDGSVEILQRYSRLPGWSHLRWISEPDRGQSDALNKGFRMAKGDVIGWLNSDDFYLRGAFQHVSKAFRDYPRTGVVYGDYVWIDENGKALQIRREVSFSRFVLCHTTVNFVQSSSAVFISSRVIDAGHFIDESYHYAMDYEYFVRLACSGYEFRHVGALLGAFRWHAESKSCAFSVRQHEEHERAQRHAWGLLGKRVGGRFSPFLRALANCRRWGEKAVRGYYFTQFFPGRVKELMRRNPIERRDDVLLVAADD